MSKNEKNTEQIKKKLSEILDTFQVEDMLKNNTIVFYYKDKAYRVRKPTFKEKQEAVEKKLEKYTQLLNDEKYFLEETLIKIYLKKGIDIDKMNKDVYNLNIAKNDLLYKLGEAIKNKANEPTLKVFKDEIQVIDNKIREITIEKTNLLGASIEQQTIIFFYTYMTYLITEKNIGTETKEEWAKLWNSFEDFENSEEDFINKACYYASLIAGINDIE